MFVELCWFLSNRAEMQTQFLNLLKHTAKFAERAEERSYLARLHHCCSLSNWSWYPENQQARAVKHLHTKFINSNGFAFIFLFPNSLRAVFNLGLWAPCSRDFCSVYAEHSSGRSQSYLKLLGTAVVYRVSKNSNQNISDKRIKYVNCNKILSWMLSYILLGFLDLYILQVFTNSRD